MRKLFLVLGLLFISSVLSAQQSSPFVMQIVADSAFIRAAPMREAEPAASVFENDNLIAIGRNIDGLWLQVRRPGRQVASGWISRDVAVFTFEIAKLPITDLVTGVTGSEPVVDTGFAVLFLSPAIMRSEADRFSTIIDTIPVNLTLPVIERTPNRLWLKVNYRGVTGWVAEFLTSTTANLDAVAVSPHYAADPSFELIAPEVQVAQIDRLLVWIDPLETTASDVAFYWTQMKQGETMECLPPAGNYAYYAYTARDLVELPELRRQLRTLTQAVDYLNDAVEAMKRCGVYTDKEIRTAYADALNAQTLFRVVERQMGNLKERILTYGS